MNLDKIDTALCFAFSVGEGPFYIKITYTDQVVYRWITSEIIKLISDNPCVVNIELDQRLIDDRRWRVRG